METLLKDLRFAARTLIKSPAFAAPVVLTLALAIGANTAVFSVVNGVVLRPLPYPEPERVVYLGWTWPSGFTSQSLTAWKYDYFRQHTTVFDAVATHGSWATEIDDAGTSDEARGLRVSEGFFRVNGVEPALGRSFSAAEDRPGGAPVTVLSDRLWRERFDSDPNVLGRSVRLGGETHTIVGVMPAGFRFPEQPAYTDFFVPFQLEPDIRDGGQNYNGRARLRADVSREQAEAELRAVSQRFRDDHPDLMAENEIGMSLMEFGDVHVGQTARTLWLFLGAVAFVLLIACVNVANLFLVRSSGRQREIAIRAAIGAGRPRIVRQLVTESLLIAVAAGGAGLLIGRWSVQALLALAPSGLPRADEIGLDTAVLAFTAGIAILTGILFGLGAALHTFRTDLSGALREGGVRQSGDRGGRRVRSTLAAAEAAIAVVLVIAASLMAADFVKLRSINTGMDLDGLIAVEFPRTPQDYTLEQVWNFEQESVQRIRAIPGVVSAASTSVLPLRSQFNFPMTVVGRPEATRGDVQWQAITPGYFDVIGVPIVRGRAFTELDFAPQATPVVIVNETFARRYFPDENPIGQRIAIGTYEGRDIIPDFTDPEREIVGVVGDVRALGMRWSPEETMFIPRPQVPSLSAISQASQTVGVEALGGFVVRTSGPVDLAPNVLRAVHEADPRVPVPALRTMGEVIGLSVAQERFNAILLGFFAVLALVLASIGIYGVVAFSVRQRAGEIGIRMALGADRTSMVGMVVRQGMTPVVAGLALGLVGAFGLTRLLSTLLFGMSPTDPATFGAVTVALTGVAFCATYLPARRAAAVDPLEALRSE